jgi:type IV pilus assembly protein PilC
MKAPKFSLEMRSLALLLEQGLPLTEAVEHLAERNPKGWRQTATRIREGASLAQAADRLPDWLCGLLQTDCQMALPELLRRAATLYDQRRARQRAWRAILIYPLVLWFGCVSLGGLMSFISQAQFGMLDIASTRVSQLMNLLSALYLRFFPLLLASPLLLGALLKRDSMRARLPVVGYAARQQEAAGCLGWLELAVEAGLPLPEALETAAAGCVIKNFRHELLQAAQACRSGSSLADISQQLKLWPALGRWALAQAEKAGFTAAILIHLRAILEEESRFYQVFLSTLMSLAVYLVAGGMLVWCAACTLIPLLNVVVTF